MKICIMKAEILSTDMYNVSRDIMNSYAQALTNPILSSVRNILVLYIICSLAYFHIKKFVRVD